MYIALNFVGLILIVAILSYNQDYSFKVKLSAFFIMLLFLVVVNAALGIVSVLLAVLFHYLLPILLVLLLALVALIIRCMLS